MQLTKNIHIIDLALFIPKKKIIIISDLHLGYENALELQGILLPRFQLKDIINSIEQIAAKTNAETIIINGDLKHEFGRILKQEWKDISRLFDYLAGKFRKIIIVKGNHDIILAPIAKKKGVEIIKEYVMDGILVCHGNKEPKKSHKTIIIGHEHPAISLKENGRTEKFKCFLKGKYKNNELIIQPSFNQLVEGTDISKREFLSPLIKDISDFEAFVVHNKQVLYFGNVKKLISSEHQTKGRTNSTVEKLFMS